MNAVWIDVADSLDREFCFRLSVTLMHFLWQGFLFAGVVGLATRLISDRDAGVRYRINVGALLLMVICIPATFAWVDSSPSTSESAAGLWGSRFSQPQPTTGASLQAPVASTDPVGAAQAAESMLVPPKSPAQHTAAGPSDSNTPWPVFATIGYLLGVFLMGLRLSLGLWGGYRLQRRASLVVDAELLRVLDQQSRRLGLRVAPTLAYCSRVGVPVVIGILRPTILLPTSVASGLTPSQLETILVHEIAHVQRLDLFMNLFQRLAESLLFFHPAVWYVSGRISAERENCCDDVVIRAGYDKTRYAQTLVVMAELCCGERTKALPQLAAAGESPSELKRRVLRLLEHEPAVKLTRHGMVYVLAACLLIAACIAIVPALGNRSEAAAPPTVSTAQDEFLTRRKQRSVSETIGRAWEKGNFDQVTAAFSPELRELLPTKKLESLWSDIESVRGPLRDVDAGGRQQIGIAMLYLIELEWKDNRLEVRLDFDEQNRVSGIWVDRPLSEGDPQKPGSGQRFGARIEEIASWSRTLDVSVENADGSPAERCRVAFYHEVSADEVSKQDDWQDPADGRRWRSFTARGGKSNVTVTRLPVGWYRAIVLQPATLAPMAASAPLQLTASETPHKITLAMKPGGTIVASPIATDDRRPLPKSRVTLETLSPQWPTLTIKPTESNNEFRFDDLPPGKYRIVGYRRADRWDGLRYESSDSSPEVEVVADKTTMTELDLLPRKLTQEEIDKRAPWIATGQVTDDQGNPMSGVEVWASAGWGSLRSYHIATSDDQGKYFGRFATSGWVRSIADPDELNSVSAQVGAHREGYAEANINRQGRLAAVPREPRADEKVPDWVGRDRLFIPGKPIEVNFVMRRAAKVTITVLDAEGKPLAKRKVRLDGDKLPPASSVMDVATTDEKGKCTFGSVPVDFDWWFDVNFAERKYVRSTALNFSQEEYNLVLLARKEAQTDKDILSVVSATKGNGIDASGEIAGTDPRHQSPLDVAEQKKARQLVADILEANRYWLSNPPAAIKGYEYDFQLSGQPKQHVHHEKGMTIQRRGISYLSPLDHLVRRPQEAVFRSIVRDEDRIELVFSFLESRRVYAGNGISGHWKGYFSTSVTDAVLVVDAKKLTPIEQKCDKFRETFSDYVVVEPGHYVPRRIQIDKMNLDWTFKLHPGGLWLFDRSTASDEKPDPLARVSNVVIK